MEELIHALEDAGVKVPAQIRAKPTTQGLVNYLQARERSLKMQIAALEDKVVFLQNQIEKKKRQVQVLEQTIQKLRRRER